MATTRLAANGVRSLVNRNTQPFCTTPARRSHVVTIAIRVAKNMWISACSVALSILKIPTGRPRAITLTSLLPSPPLQLPLTFIPAPPLRDREIIFVMNHNFDSAEAFVCPFQEDLILPYGGEPRNDAEEFTYRPFTFPSNPHNNGDGFTYSSGENFIPPSDIRNAVTGPYHYDTGRIQPMLPNPTGIVMPASAQGWNISTAIHYPQDDLSVLPTQQPVTHPSMMSLDTAHVNPADTLLTGPPHGSIAPQPHVAPQINLPKRCEWENCGATLLDTSNAGIKKHLRQFHSVADSKSVCCLWCTGSTVCKHNMQLVSLVRHIAEMHLRTSEVQCQDCGHLYVRADVLRKHRKGNSCGKRR
ncbi:hypothetical protein SCP_1500960 [Sparassis crispa]|uniref:C2H2-type domain-containing protein n=1 Tax=Sparassis crispa TaxID=139825 RepID=A0A401H3W0_9APHY|nr:hypothetical protein SCP_1500960 [Sparassis crispa]GBE89093.1 hypothetical protein SCP_1500960 [Sparassis crispa]